MYENYFCPVDPHLIFLQKLAHKDDTLHRTRWFECLLTHQSIFEGCLLSFQSSDGLILFLFTYRFWHVVPFSPTSGILPPPIPLNLFRTIAPSPTSASSTCCKIDLPPSLEGVQISARFESESTSTYGYFGCGLMSSPAYHLSTNRGGNSGEYAPWTWFPST